MSDRFTLRWDASMGCYRVSAPNIEGPIEVVRASLADAIVEAWERNLLPAIPGEAETLRLKGYREIGEAVAAYKTASE